ncbi:hypothetical protein Bbelb_318600 [Branchiostoma belcheri]|nr:hypothetical protein Bbelb_318600 [Branchiostoma belcheri]
MAKKCFGRLAELRSLCRNGIPVLALTASADAKTRKDIVHLLRLKKDNIRGTKPQQTQHQAVVYHVYLRVRVIRMLEVEAEPAPEPELIHISHSPPPSPSSTVATTDSPAYMPQSPSISPPSLYNTTTWLIKNSMYYTNVYA